MTRRTAGSGDIIKQLLSRFSDQCARAVEVGRVYAVFLSLFPLLFGIGLILVAIEHEGEVPLASEITVPREVFMAAGAAFVLIAVLMIVMSRRVERALHAFTNLLLPEALRIRLQGAGVVGGQREAPPDVNAGNRAARVLKQGRDYQLSRDYVLTSHIFSARTGLLVGGLLLLPVVAHWVAFFLNLELPSTGLLDLLFFFMFIFGLGFLGKRNVIRVYQKEETLEDWSRIWWHQQSSWEPLKKFDRVILRRWRLPGLGGGPRTHYTRHPVLGVFYLVQLGGSGMRTINFYRRHSDARDLAFALADLTRLPVTEA